jgi:hypothetical protein
MLTIFKPEMVIMKNVSAFLILLIFISFMNVVKGQSWIRINQLGYTPLCSKVAVWGSKKDTALKIFELVDGNTNKTVYKGTAGKTFGHYGPFVQTYRLNFSAFIKPARSCLTI